MNTHPVRTLLVIMILITSFDCKKEESTTTPTPPSTAKVTLGTSVDAGSTVISSSGGTITIVKSGAPIDGMTITVPENSFSETRTFAVSYAPIIDHKFGQYFNPISPMITISNGGGYTDSIMTVRIPVKIPADEFALAFFYNEKTQTLEPLPLLAEDSSSITIATMHFDPNTISGSVMNSSGGPTTQGWRALANLVVSSIIQSKINSVPLISSGFLPGVDDWEFINYGSIVEPGGHCAGQSESAMYYYYEEKLLNAPALNKLFDRVHSSSTVLWQDNPRGYRWASAVQHDLVFNKLSLQMIAKAATPHVQFYAFALGMLVSGEPQFVGMMSTTSGEGHAMVVYAVAPSEGKLYVADPNYPGDNSRVIKLVNNKLGPYAGAARADDPSDNYDLIGNFGKTAFVRWDKIGGRYDDFVNGTIGSDIFPNYQLTSAGATLGDTLQTSATSLNVDIADVAPSNTPGLSYSCFDTTGAALNVAVPLPLHLGWNNFGFYVKGLPKPTATDLAWLDFRWVAVCSNPCTIDAQRADGAPVLIPGQVGVDYTLQCNGHGSAPASRKYVWDFGDGTSSFTQFIDSTATHAFAKNGTFHVNVEVWDNALSKKLVDVKRDVTISPQAVVSGSMDSSSTIIGQMKLVFHCDWSVRGLNATVVTNKNGMVTVGVAAGSPVHVTLNYPLHADPNPFIVEYPADQQKHVYTADSMQTDTTLFPMGKFPCTFARNGEQTTIDFTFSSASQSLTQTPNVKFLLKQQDYYQGNLYSDTKSQRLLDFLYFTVESQ